MLRKDREIEGIDEIADVLKRCDSLSIGIQGGDCPYVVPVSFGAARNGDTLTVYFHGAKRGLKAEMLEDNPRVCVEGHIFYRVEPIPHGITTRYESVIGFGTAERVEGDEAVAGLKCITEHYNYPEYPAESCESLPATAVYKINIDTITGKRNLS